MRIKLLGGPYSKRVVEVKDSCSKIVIPVPESIKMSWNALPMRKGEPYLPTTVAEYVRSRTYGIFVLDQIRTI